jgi:hypothetical protein
MRREALKSTMNESKNSITNSTEMVAIPLVKLDNLIAAVDLLKTGKLRPFMYSIQRNGGHEAPKKPKE